MTDARQLQYAANYRRKRSEVQKEEHRIKSLASQKKHRKIKGAYIQLVKQAGCLHCPETDPRCLDFHHRDPETKKFGICRAANSGYSLEALINEIEKCDLICANCHRKHHV